LIACLVFNESEIPHETIKQIITSEFKWNEYEFCEVENKTAIYLWNVEKIEIWQMVLLLEVSHVKVGYGFGPYKNYARKKAEHKLMIRCMEEEY